MIFEGDLLVKSLSIFLLQIVYIRCNEICQDHVDKFMPMTTTLFDNFRIILKKQKLYLEGLYFIKTTKLSYKYLFYYTPQVIDNCFLSSRRLFH